MRIQTSDFPKSASNALLVELRKKYWSTFARNYMSETCEMKVSGGLSWGFKPQIHRFCCQILYLPTYTKLVQLFFLCHNKLLSSVCFLSVWSTGYTKAVIQSGTNCLCRSLIVRNVLRKVPKPFSYMRIQTSL